MKPFSAYIHGCSVHGYSLTKEQTAIQTQGRRRFVPPDSGNSQAQEHLLTEHMFFIWTPMTQTQTLMVSKWKTLGSENRLNSEV